ncbi:gliding motility-associated C-terminal domain-containing protein [Telluribacter sp. SYSU D00476]|uniref:gliding motility-associated C-terminal domain-containing protein n=1 Tax=Telluribacter sp. SYSU D00476 TaxID=2811430 RepID=UPI001FF128D1|nr:gliding motility-associated C-terminal domain-containing protein [Telluribacter sp. SYSU D00476]
MRGRRLLPIYILVLLLCIAQIAWARHIVGGELAFRPTATPNRYEITMIQYWDENTLSGMNRDQTAEVLLYRKRDNRLMGRTTISFVSARNISYQNRACAAFRSLRTLEGTYSGFITLNAASYNDPEGYYLVWERCCRNDDINNIIQPGDSGMTFYLEIPPLTEQDASPRFNLPNGAYICKDQPFKLNMGATDQDGDELRYSLVVPLRGNTSRTFPIGDDSPKRGYPSVMWAPGISLTNVIPGNPSLQINASTGELSVTANSLGLYVFAVQCEEYRNGRRIGLVRRDFQLLVIECSQTTPPEPTITYNNQNAVDVSFCPEKPIELATSKSPDWAYQWQLNGQNIPGATTNKITVQDTGKYTVVKSFKTICSRDTASLPVRVSYGTPPPATIHSLADAFCTGQALLLTANDGSRTPGHSYGWFMENQKMNISDPTCSVKAPGMYVLRVSEDNTGCAATDTVVVKEETVDVKLPASMGVQLGKSVQLFPVVASSSADLYFNWAPSAGVDDIAVQNPHVIPTETTTYTVRVQTALGCFDEATILINVFDKLYIPDAFSPNGDGINDTFEIANAVQQVEEIQIFNRWGETVFYSRGYGSPWDGFYKGKVVEPGSYIYIIKAPFQTFKGQILVLH